MIVSIRDKVDGLARALPESAAYAGLVCFVDPIDGTREFCTGKGEQCSICIGFAEIASGMRLTAVADGCQCRAPDCSTAQRRSPR